MTTEEKIQAVKELLGVQGYGVKARSPHYIAEYRGDFIWKNMPYGTVAQSNE